MVNAATLAELSVATQIYAVAQAAYALEAKRISCADFPPLRESLQELQQSSDSFLVFQQSGCIIGALSFESCTDSVVITRLVVAPTHLRQGIATALLSGLEQRHLPGLLLTVSTARANTPAVLFYQSRGFTIASRSHSREGIPLLHFTKSNTHTSPKVT